MAQAHHRYRKVTVSHQTLQLIDKTDAPCSYSNRRSRPVHVYSGATIATQAFDMSNIGGIFFVENFALEFGGALSLANYVEVNISDVTFKMNEAESGGAVSLTSTTWTTANLKRCRFEENKGTRGGALFLDGNGLGILFDSSFWLNVAGET